MLPSLKVCRTRAVCLKDFILSGTYRSKLPLLFLAIIACISTGRVASAQDRDPLDLLTEESEQTVTTGHIPRPTSKIAENITVITADDITRINAHTLADVLQTVPGIQLDVVRTPGSSSFFNIQGEYNTQIMVMIDGVPQQNFNQNQAVPPRLTSHGQCSHASSTFLLPPFSAFRPVSMTPSSHLESYLRPMLARQFSAMLVSGIACQAARCLSVRSNT